MKQLLYIHLPQGDGMRTMSFVRFFVLTLAFAGLVELVSTRSADAQFGKRRAAGSTEPKLNAELSPLAGEPNQALLAITLQLPPQFRTYSTNESHSQTKISLELTDLAALTGFVSDPPPTMLNIEFNGDMEVFRDRVTWYQRFEIKGHAPSLEGKVFFIVCGESGTNDSCVPFTKKISAEISTIAAELPEVLRGATPATAVVDTGKEPNPFAEPETSAHPLDPAAHGMVFKNLQVETAGEETLLWQLVAAFLGGLILNVMPCVLPVIAIKAISFAEQAGEKRGRILALNLMYSLGVIAVFVLLATLAVTVGLKWGGLFSQLWFNLLMIGLVFTMALSLFGVFELQVPGTIGSAAGGHREGLFGAMMTGVFATLLATPCSGPFMGPVLAWSLKQTPEVVFLIWSVMGVGMAFPYLVMGVFPSLVNWLPKPGMWMVRFKEFAGIVLMGTVIWLINGTDNGKLALPILIGLTGIGLFCWMVGKLYDGASSQSRRWTVRVLGLLVAGPVCYFGYTLGSPEPAGSIKWNNFSGTALDQSVLAEGRTTLVDFSAEWCAICKVNENMAIKTKATSEFVKDNNIATLYADYTHHAPEITQWLDRFHTTGVPLTVIFPANRPYEPIVISGTLTKGQLLSKLKEAVAIPKSEKARTAQSDADRRGAAISRE